jgi:hypothetical protein
VTWLLCRAPPDFLLPVYQQEAGTRAGPDQEVDEVLDKACRVVHAELVAVPAVQAGLLHTALAAAARRCEAGTPVSSK